MNCENKLCMTKKKAFTLIELLIIIAIIGILFIVLISKVNFATDKAKASGVQTDFRSFQLAFETVAREQSGFSHLVNEDYEQLEMAINKNLDNKLKIDIGVDGTITMANNATDPWNVEYHGQYVTGNDGKDRGAIVMYSNGADFTFGSTAVVVNGVVSINTTDEAGNDDYSLAIIYSLNGGAGRIDASTTGFSNNLTASDGTPGENAPDYDNEALVFKLLAGIYEPGAIDVCKKEGLEAAQDMMIMSWEDMVANEYVYVYDGDVCDGYVCANYDYYDMFNGDLIFPADGSVLVIDIEAFPGMNLTGVVIPSTIVCINDIAFCETPLETVCFAPNSQLEYIGYASFADCWYLENMVIPDNVKYIGDYAFAACESLLDVTINDNLEEMGYAPFYGCISLESITLPFTGMYKGGSPESEAYNNLFGYIFGTEYYEGGVMTRQFWQSISKWTDVCIPSSLKTVTITGNKVSSYAFCGCNFENVIIGDKVEVIETAAFFGGFDGGFTNITMGTNVKVVEDGAFFVNFENFYVNNLAGWCSMDFGDYSYPDPGLTYVNGELLSDMVDLVIPDGVTRIGARTLQGCSSLTSITIPDSVTSIGAGALQGCSNLTSVTIPDSVTSIGASAFSSCDSLTSIAIPDGVTSIGSGAFRNCRSLTNLTIGNGVTSIGEWAFDGCDALQNVNITDIAKWCDIDFMSNPLRYAKNLYLNGTLVTNLTIPNGVTSICNFAFRGCTSLTSVTIPDSVTLIGDYAFMDCSSLTSIEIPNSVTNIGDRAFSDCTGLISIEIPDSVTNIGGYAFSGCDSLTSVTIPDSVTSIGGGAFEDCTSLTSVVIGNGVTSIGGGAFEDCTSLTSIEIPNNVTSIGSYAFNNCSSLQYNEYDNAYYLGNNTNPYLLLVKAKNTNITSCNIHNNTRFVHSSAFSGCNSLTSIEIPDSVTTIGSYAFHNCSNLTNATLGNSVTSIDYYTFWYCTNLTNITITSSSVLQYNGYNLSGKNLTAIYVNSNLVEQYKKADGWRDFEDKIQAIPTT